MFVLSVLGSNIVKTEASAAAFVTLAHRTTGRKYGMVEIPRSAFLRASTPIKLLALAGLRSCINSTWRSKMLALLRHENLDGKPSGNVERLRDQIASEL